MSKQLMITSDDDPGNYNRDYVRRLIEADLEKYLLAWEAALIESLDRAVLKSKKDKKDYAWAVTNKKFPLIKRFLAESKNVDSSTPDENLRFRILNGTSHIVRQHLPMIRAKRRSATDLYCQWFTDGNDWMPPDEPLIYMLEMSRSALYRARKTLERKHGIKTEYDKDAGCKVIERPREKTPEEQLQDELENMSAAELLKIIQSHKNGSGK